MYEQRIENVKIGQSACKQSRGTSRIRLKYLSVEFLFSIEIGQRVFISSSVFYLFFSLMFSTSYPTYFLKRIRRRRIKIRGKQDVKQFKNSCTRFFGGFQKGVFTLKKNLNQLQQMLKEELVKNFKKALTSWQKVKVTSCILPQRNLNSVEKLIRYSFIHKGFLLIHEKLTD